MILNLLDPFLASRLDLVSRNDGCDGGGYTYGRLYKYHDMSRFDGFMFGHSSTGLTTIIPSSTDTTSKGSFVFVTEPSLDTASKTSELAPEISWDSIIGRTRRSRRRST
jgi:hypothetical protein